MRMVGDCVASCTQYCTESCVVSLAQRRFTTVGVAMMEGVATEAVEVADATDLDLPGDRWRKHTRPILNYGSPFLQGQGWSSDAEL
jgi:hypothetical protein